MPMGGGTDLRATGGEPMRVENADAHGAKPDATPDAEDTAAGESGTQSGETVGAGTDASRETP